ncbi:MAG: DUF3618 domain-containing protein [Egicoccus sp.]
MTTDYATQTSQDPEQLRREIARTRADMDRTLAQLEDRVSPTRIRERQTAKVRGRFNRAKSAVMGSSSDTGGMVDSAGNALSDAGDTIQETPHMVEDATRGNPLAAGVIAMGVGALLGSLVPTSKPEEQLAGQLRDNFEEPVKEQLQQAGQEMRGELQEHAQHAAEETKQSAQHAMKETKDQAQDSTAQVQDKARDSAQNVRDQR